MKGIKVAAVEQKMVVFVDDVSFCKKAQLFCQFEVKGEEFGQPSTLKTL